MPPLLLHFGRSPLVVAGSGGIPRWVAVIFGGFYWVFLLGSLGVSDFFLFFFDFLGVCALVWSCSSACAASCWDGGLLDHLIT